VLSVALNADALAVNAKPLPTGISFSLPAKAINNVPSLPAAIADIPPCGSRFVVVSVLEDDRLLANPAVSGIASTVSESIITDTPNPVPSQTDVEFVCKSSFRIISVITLLRILLTVESVFPTARDRNKKLVGTNFCADSE
jgi:hypothetical protein